MTYPTIRGYLGQQCSMAEFVLYLKSGYFYLIYEHVSIGRTLRLMTLCSVCTYYTIGYIRIEIISLLKQNNPILIIYLLTNRAETELNSIK